MKIAILGTENSHAYAFAKLIFDNQKYNNIELVGIYGYDDAANQKIIDDGFASYAAKRPDEFLGKVDAIMVTARHGNLHYEYALSYIKQGIPAFIDKPFTVDLTKGDKLIQAAKENGALLCGGSSLKAMDEFAILHRYCEVHEPVGGYVAAPINMVNNYGNFYFYAQHLVECMIAIFGTDIHAVRARRPHEGENRISMVFDYGAFDVTAQYTSSYTYAATVIAKDGYNSISCGAVSYCYERELDEFIGMIKSRKMPRDYEALVFPAKLLHAIENAYLTGKEVDVKKSVKHHGE